MANSNEFQRIKVVLQAAKELAKEYRQITGKPLGITGEIGEYYAADTLNLNLTLARNPGYDAIAQDGRRIQIKTRCILPNAKPGQRIGCIRFTYEWDTVMLVLINENYELMEIYEAKRDNVESELAIPGSKARNERGALGVLKFMSIAEKVWPLIV